MAEFPALPIWTDAYLGDTRHLSAAQHGGYFLLLITAWRTHDCALPNDDKLLARWAAMSGKAWQANKAVIMAFWELGEDNKWRQGKLFDVRQKVALNVNQKSSAGVASSLKRKENGQRLLVRNSNGNSTNQNQNHNHSSSNEKRAVKSGDKFEICRDEVLPSTWHDYAEQKGVPDAQIYASWKKFKEKSPMPLQLKKWKAWIDRERVK